MKPLNPRGKCLFLTNRDTKDERVCGLKTLARLEQIARPTNGKQMYCRRHLRVVLARL